MDGASPTSSSATLAIPRLPFIDGLRGWAALVVMVGHFAAAAGYLVPDGPDSFLDVSWSSRAFWLFWPSTQMVYLFLAISGFSLFYSEDVRRAAGRAATKVKTFFGRRAWRILPVYYAALGFGLLTVPGAHLFGDLGPDTPEPVTIGGFASHLVLLHNVQEQWLFQINGPLWSMAYEWQLYLFFPLLYAASKRWSVLVVGGLALVIDVLLAYWHPTGITMGMGRWFALGMIAAGTYRSAWVQRIPTKLLIAIGSTAVALTYLGLGPIADHYPVETFVWGTGLLTLIWAMTRAPASKINPFNARWLRWVGQRSYSLYAFHFPVLFWFVAVLETAGYGGKNPTRTIVLFAVGIPVTFAVTELVHRYIERPSLERARRLRVTERAPTIPAAVAPATD